MATILFFDLRQDSLSVCQIDRDKKVVLSRETYAITTGEILPSEFKTSFENTGDCFLSLPLSMLNFRIIEMPFSDPRKIRDLLPFELEGLILDGASSVIFDAGVLGEQNDKYRVFVAYILKESLSAVLNFLKNLGLEPKLAISLELADVFRRSKDGEAVADLLLEPQAQDLREPDNETLMETGLREISQPSFNFRRAEFAYTVDDAKQKKARTVAAVLALLVILIFIVDMAVVAISTKRGNTSMRDEIRRTYTSVYPDDKKISDEVYQMKAHIKELKEKESSFIGIAPLQVMLQLAKVVKPGIMFNEISVDSNLIVMKGECPSLGDAQKVKTDLEALFSEVNIMDTKPSAQNKTQFTISARGVKP